MIAQKLQGGFSASTEWFPTGLVIEWKTGTAGRITVEPQAEGGFVAKHEGYPGAIGQGETEQEAILDLLDAVESLKEFARNP